MRKGSHFSAEQLIRLREAHNTYEALERSRKINLGRRHTPESIEKTRRANLGRQHTPDEIEKQRCAQATPEAKKRARQSHMGKHPTPETIEKIRQALIGRQHSPERIEKTRKAQLGKHYGCLTPQHIEKIRRAANTPEAIEHNRRAHLGKPVSSSTREKISRGNRGKKLSDETKIKIRQATRTLEARERMRVISAQHFEDPTFLKKWMKGMHSKTRPEKHLEQLLQSLYPGEFRYNGRFDCGICIDRLFPDFVNVNGKKQVIDVHGSYWHEGEDISERMARYAKYGYSSLIIWDHELKAEKAVVQRITEFVGMEPHLYFEIDPVASSQKGIQDSIS